MYTKIVSPLRPWMFSFFLLGLLMACSNEPNAEEVEAAAAEQDVAAQAVAAQASVASGFFSGAEMEAIVSLKKQFEEGLRQAFPKRTVGYAYTQNSLRMRLNYIEKDQADMPFPFQGGFSFEKLSEDVEKLSFVSKKCGYLVGESEEQINYYCLALNKNYFDYLEAIPETNNFIKDFAEMYKNKKSVTSGFREKFLMRGMENLDLDNWDHQLFYMFFQCWINEELEAYLKANAAVKN